MIYGLLTLISLALIFVVYVHVKAFEYQQKEHNETLLELNQQWKEERQQLLDRIQAPSFDHLKQAEVRVIKAQKDEPPIERVELL